MGKEHVKKQAKVKAERGFSPDEVRMGGELLDVRVNVRYTDQFIELYWFDNYVWVVPVDIKTERSVTAFKSRKAKKEFKK